MPEDIREYKALIKNIIRELSCKKRYTIWYEFWNAPDPDGATEEDDDEED